MTIAAKKRKKRHSGRDSNCMVVFFLFGIKMNISRTKKRVE
jgi:hypothetical protein